jgi:uncharacterized protein YbjT (DUF2867 family)
MSNKPIFVVGACGFIGSRVVAQLVSSGFQVLIPVRRTERAKHLVTLPGVEVVAHSLSDEASVAKVLLEGHSAGPVGACINLAGILHGRSGAKNDPYGPDFGRVHVELPQRLALACQDSGVKRFIHLSALGVTDGGKKTLPSRYLRSKAAGEQVIKQTLGLATTILRPSVVFGEQDKFLNLFAQLQALAPVLPLAGAQVRFQPIYVGDVASAVVHALQNSATIGQTYELAGPDVFTLRELAQLAGQVSGHRRPIIGLPNFLAQLQASVMEVLPGPTLMSRDNLDSMKVDNIIKPTTTVSLEAMQARVQQDLGLTPRALPATLRSYMTGASKGNSLDAMRSRAGR